MNGFFRIRKISDLTRLCVVPVMILSIFLSFYLYVDMDKIRDKSVDLVNEVIPHVLSTQQSAINLVHLKRNIEIMTAAPDLQMARKAYVDTKALVSESELASNPLLQARADDVLLAVNRLWKLRIQLDDLRANVNSSLHFMDSVRFLLSNEHPELFPEFPNHHTNYIDLYKVSFYSRDLRKEHLDAYNILKERLDENFDRAAFLKERAKKEAEAAKFQQERINNKTINDEYGNRFSSADAARAALGLNQEQKREQPRSIQDALIQNISEANNISGRNANMANDINVIRTRSANAHNSTKNEANTNEAKANAAATTGASATGTANAAGDKAAAGEGKAAGTAQGNAAANAEVDGATSVNAPEPGFMQEKVAQDPENAKGNTDTTVQGKDPQGNPLVHYYYDDSKRAENARERDVRDNNDANVEFAVARALANSSHNGVPNGQQTARSATVGANFKVPLDASSEHQSARVEVVSQNAQVDALTGPKVVSSTASSQLADEYAYHVTHSNENEYLKKLLNYHPHFSTTEEGQRYDVMMLNIYKQELDRFSPLWDIYIKLQHVFSYDTAAVLKQVDELSRSYTTGETSSLHAELSEISYLAAETKPMVMVTIGFCLVGFWAVILLLNSFIIAPLKNIARILIRFRHTNKVSADDFSKFATQDHLLEIREIVDVLPQIFDDFSSIQKSSDVLQMRYDELVTHSKYDDLTKIFNRNSLNLLIRQVGSHTPANFAVFMIDIDHFKLLNDSMGHQRGDEVLFAVAQTISTHLSQKDMVYRYGGEEFCVILNDVTPATSYKVARRLCSTIKLLKLVNEGVPSKIVTVSIGVSLVTSSPNQFRIEELISQADKALYLAKRNGRDRVVACPKSIVFGSEEDAAQSTAWEAGDETVEKPIITKDDATKLDTNGQAAATAAATAATPAVSEAAEANATVASSQGQANAQETDKPTNKQIDANAAKQTKTLVEAKAMDEDAATNEAYRDPSALGTQANDAISSTYESEVKAYAAPNLYEENHDDAYLTEIEKKRAVEREKAIARSAAAVASLDDPIIIAKKKPVNANQNLGNAINSQETSVAPEGATTSRMGASSAKAPSPAQAEDASSAPAADTTSAQVASNSEDSGSDVNVSASANDAASKSDAVASANASNADEAQALSKGGSSVALKGDAGRQSASGADRTDGVSGANMAEGMPELYGHNEEEASLESHAALQGGSQDAATLMVKQDSSNPLEIANKELSQSNDASTTIEVLAQMESNLAESEHNAELKAEAKAINEAAQRAAKANAAAKELAQSRGTYVAAVGSSPIVGTSLAEGINYALNGEESTQNHQGAAMASAMASGMATATRCEQLTNEVVAEEHSVTFVSEHKKEFYGEDSDDLEVMADYENHRHTPLSTNASLTSSARTENTSATSAHSSFGAGRNLGATGNASLQTSFSADEYKHGNIISTDNTQAVTSSTAAFLRNAQGLDADSASEVHASIMMGPQPHLGKKPYKDFAPHKNYVKVDDKNLAGANEELAHPYLPFGVDESMSKVEADNSSYVLSKKDGEPDPNSYKSSLGVKQREQNAALMHSNHFNNEISDLDAARLRNISFEYGMVDTSSNENMQGETNNRYIQSKLFSPTTVNLGSTNNEAKPLNSHNKGIQTFNMAVSSIHGAAGVPSSTMLDRAAAAEALAKNAQLAARIIPTPVMEEEYPEEADEDIQDSIGTDVIDTSRFSKDNTVGP